MQGGSKRINQCSELFTVKIVGSSGLRHCVGLYAYINVSEEHAAFIFRTKVCGIRNRLGCMGKLQERQ